MGRKILVGVGGWGVTESVFTLGVGGRSFSDLGG